MMDTGGSAGRQRPPRPGSGSSSRGVVGLATSVAFVYITQYYTAGGWRPVKEIAEASKTGPATNIIAGTAVGFETTFVTAIAIGIALLASFWLGEQAGLVERGRRQRRRHLRHRRGDHGHAHDHGLHPGHGHLRPHHRQRRRHRRVLQGGGRRPRDHRPAGRRRQHHQGAHQGLRHRVGQPRRVPALQRLHRQGQHHPGAAQGKAHRWSSVNLANVERLRGRLHRRDAGLLLQLAGHPRRGHTAPGDHRRGAAPVPRDARHHGLQPAAGLRARRRHHDPRRAARR